MPQIKESKISRLKFQGVSWPDILALIICAWSFLIWLNLLYTKFLYFGYYDWDLAMYAQATWALSHGVFHSSLFGTNFLTNHAEYIAFFIAPVYRLFPSALTLVVFKILSLTAGSYFFYLIVKKLLGPALGLIFLLLYLVHPANLFMMIYEFHFENLAIVFIFMMFYFMLENRLFAFLVSAFFATLVKENISLVVFLFGFYALLTKKDKKLAWFSGPLFLGGIFFILTMFYITPHLRALDGINSSNQYISMYWDSGDKASTLPVIFAKNFHTHWKMFWSPLNRHYIWVLFAPFHVLPYLSPLTLLLGTTIFLQHFFAPNYQMHTLHYHYAATAVIFIFLACAQSFVLLKKILRPGFYYILLILTVFSVLLFARNNLPLFQDRISQWVDRLDPIRQSMFEKIPPDAATVASFDFLERLTERKELHSLHSVWQNYGTFTGKSPYILPFDLSYGLIDWKCPWLWGEFLLPSSKSTKMNILNNIHHFYYGRSWRIVQAVEDITLLSTVKGDMPQTQLVNNVQDQNPRNHQEINAEIGESLKLISIGIEDKDTIKSRILPISFYWEAKSKMNDFYFSEISIWKDGQMLLKRLHPIGYAFNATPLWAPGQKVRETYNLFSQKLVPGEYELTISVINRNKNTTESLQTQAGKAKTISLYFSLK